MRRELVVIILVMLTIITGCSGQEKVPGQEDRPSEEVPQTDEYSSPTGPDKLEEQTERSIDESDDFTEGDRLDGQDQKLTYQADIKVILDENCINCHKKESVVGKKNKFSNYQEVRRFVKPNQPEKSKLIISIQDDNSMRKYISIEEINTIEAWVEAGAPK
ncbi:MULTISPECIES: hypothetical protein [unclassified Candidatus Frackibacter]|uniref:hypothetical protein n=1 Tax=unclassified Candidatus Frackibacter TaxID=2648818 RepID=UPI000886DD2D|nr:MULTISPECIES: hypothetical protein [unclassified Candidatus Frackibacter]SDC70498.1 hypothetical protein SAMN04515661_12024 [Candidatus Frackibacter sp. WG11]SEM85025.1 hypothetical protein SAMN04488698_12028 [Candidatus Frackibacter sp. WG12]SFL94259.1 hypothetical protein SAMN04488699_12128 [Candidatus Frackibacter sp. WG13]